MEKIVFATTNDGKVKEIKEILKDFPIEVVSMKEMNISIDIEENGADFEENSLIGRDTDYDYKNNYIIDKLSQAKGKERRARFVCVISLVLPDGREFVKRGVMEGLIGYEQRGGNGFGYDPIFYLPEYGRTSAELSPDEKNKISHRGKALQAMRELILDLV